MPINPLLGPLDPPPYEAIRLEHLQPAIEQIIADNTAALLALIAEMAAHHGDTSGASAETLGRETENGLGPLPGRSRKATPISRRKGWMSIWPVAKLT